MAAVIVHRVVGDLTLGKPELVEFAESETVGAAIAAVAACADGEIPVWRRRSQGEPVAAGFVGVISSLDLIAFLARAGGDSDAAMRTPVADVVNPNPSLLKEVDPRTRLIDALDVMKQGAKHLLVRKSSGLSTSKRSPSGKWLKNIDTSASTASIISSSHPSLLPVPDLKYCCLSREDIVRFLIGCLGALAPIPLSSISALGAVTPHYSYIEASDPALEAIHKLSQDHCAIAVVETNSNGTQKVIGEISAYKLCKGDYLDAAWAMANLSAGQFVMGTEEDGTAAESFPNFSVTALVDDHGTVSSPRAKIFSSRNIGFFSSQMPVRGLRPSGSIYRGRTAPLTCEHTSSLAAVMAQMLSHRATHVWVTQAEAEEDDILVGVVSYSDIFVAVTKPPGYLATAAL